MEYSIHVNRAYSKNNVLGYASVVFNKSFRVDGIAIKLNNRTGEWFVSMPCHSTGGKDQNGNTVYKDVCNPTTAEFRARLYEDILFAFHDATQNMASDKETEVADDCTICPPKFIIKVVPFERENSNICAFVHIVLDDCFAVNSARLVRSGDKIFLAMPSYKRKQTDENGASSYQDICYPVTKEFKNSLQSSAVKAYNRQIREDRGSETRSAARRPAGKKSYQKNSHHGRHR